MIYNDHITRLWLTLSFYFLFCFMLICQIQKLYSTISILWDSSFYCKVNDATQELRYTPEANVPPRVKQNLSATVFTGIFTPSKNLVHKWFVLMNENSWPGLELGSACIERHWSLVLRLFERGHSSEGQSLACNQNLLKFCIFSIRHVS